MKCPICGHPTTSVTETRETAYGTRRRRRCGNLPCDHRFTTAEFPTPWPAHAMPKGIAIVDLRDLEHLRKVLDRLSLSKSK